MVPEGSMGATRFHSTPLGGAAKAVREGPRVRFRPFSFAFWATDAPAPLLVAQVFYPRRVKSPPGEDGGEQAGRAEYTHPAPDLYPYRPSRRPLKGL
jgi:hypothetical protein